MRENERGRPSKRINPGTGSGYERKRQAGAPMERRDRPPVPPGGRPEARRPLNRPARPPVETGRRPSRPTGNGNINPARGGRRRGDSPRQGSFPLRKNRIWMVWAFFFIVFAGYLAGSYMKGRSKPDIAETKLVIGSVDKPEIIKGLAVRDEKIYKSPGGGVVLFEVGDKERIKKGAVICSLSDEAKVAKLEKSLENVKNGIMSLQTARNGYSSLYDEEVNEANSQIKAAVDSLSFAFSQGDVAGLYNLKDRAGEILYGRNQLLLNENKGSLRSLVDEKNIYENQISDAMNYVNAEDSGIIVYKADGMEDSLTLDRLSGLTKDETLIDVGSSDFSARRTVAQGDALFKVVKSSDWYICAYISKKLTESWNLNGTKTIYVEKDGVFLPVETVVTRLDQAGDDVYVVFKTNKMTLEFMEARSVSFRLTDKVTEGIKIPNTAIVEKALLKIPNNCVFIAQNTPTIMKVTDSGEKALSIKPIKKDENFTYVAHEGNRLLLGDQVVSQGQTREVVTINDFETVKGVYITNTGAAVFTIIDTGGRTSQNAEYTVLDPASNQGLKIHDRVATDGKAVEHSQIIY